MLGYNQQEGMKSILVIPYKTFKFHDEIEGRNAKNRVVEGEFQTVTQRTCTHYSYPKEEDDDVGDSIEPAMSTQNPFPRFFSILTPLQERFL